MPRYLMRLAFIGLLPAWFLLIGSGCLHLGIPGKCGPAPCSTAQLTRNHVYIFLVDGLDVCGFNELYWLRRDLYVCGFNKTYYGQCYHCLWFSQQMDEVAKNDPAARFVLIGSSLGTQVVPHLQNHAEKKGYAIDLVVASGYGESECGWVMEKEGAYPQAWQVQYLLNEKTKRDLLTALAAIAGQIPIEGPGQSPGGEGSLSIPGTLPQIPPAPGQNNVLAPQLRLPDLPHFVIHQGDRGS